MYIEKQPPNANQEHYHPMVTEPAQYHLCHLNIGPAKAPLSDPVMEGFVARLDQVNTLAYQSPGFIWHLKIDIHNMDDLMMYGVPGLLFNLSVWESPEALRAYVYSAGHAEAMKLRRDWFGAMDTPNYVLWWLPTNQLPTLEEGKRRIAHLETHGPTLEAFTFKHSFSAPNVGTGGTMELIHLAPLFAPPQKPNKAASDAKKASPLG